MNEWRGLEKKSKEIDTFFTQSNSFPVYLYTMETDFKNTITKLEGQCTSCSDFANAHELQTKGKKLIAPTEGSAPLDTAALHQLVWSI